MKVKKEFAKLLAYMGMADYLYHKGFRKVPKSLEWMTKEELAFYKLGYNYAKSNS